MTLEGKMMSWIQYFYIYSYEKHNQRIDKHKCEE